MVCGATDDVYKSVLGGNAHYYQELVCRSDDFTVFEALVEELEYRPCWMSGGMPLWRPTAIGAEETLAKSPTYERVVRELAGHFGVQPIRSIVNFYRNGDDFTSPHSDQYFSGVNMTIGASFGEERLLVFEHRDSREQFSFPQHNGDVFAFTAEVNDKFAHSVPKAKRRAASVGRRGPGGRVSVVIWAKRDQAQWKTSADKLPLSLLDSPHVLQYDPNIVAEDDVSRREQSVHPHFPETAKKVAAVAEAETELTEAAVAPDGGSTGAATSVNLEVQDKIPGSGDTPAAAAPGRRWGRHSPGA
jgi:hypothetical protein